MFFSFEGGLDNVEYYDIKLNEWKMVSPMPWKGVTVKCAAVGSIVYVLASGKGVLVLNRADTLLRITDA